MPLPAENTRWPPEEWVAPFDKMSEWAAWYSGDPERIIEAYAASTIARPQGVIPWWRFWSRARDANTSGSQRALLHVPVASDLAAVSASLLFGEAPRIRIPDAHANEAPEAPPEPVDPTQPNQLPDPVTRPETPEQKLEKRLIDMTEEGEVIARLLEAAESGSAIGGVYIYPAWDKDLRPWPIFAYAQADMAIPTFRRGFLAAVTFHRVVATDGNVTWRHVEVHEVEGTGNSRRGVVLNALYRGSEQDLGVRVPLTAVEETAGLLERVPLPFPELDVEYVPNIRPNRLWRASGLGVADVQGSESLLDAVDEVYASWMRDVRLAKARIVVPRDYLRNDEDGNPQFDVDHEIYTALEMEPSLNADARMMLAHQFAIRYNEHRATSRELIERIVSNAGYTPGTLGQSSAMEGGGTATGTALRVSEHKTLLTLRRKAAFWRPAVSRTLRRMMAIDREVFGNKEVPSDWEKIPRPVVEINDSVIDQPLELAQTALALKSAESASIESRVRIIHPDWSEAEVASEVARIKDELEAAKPPTPISAGMFGDPTDDATATGKKPTTKPGDAPSNGQQPPPSPPKGSTR